MTRILTHCCWRDLLATHGQGFARWDCALMIMNVQNSFSTSNELFFLSINRIYQTKFGVLRSHGLCTAVLHQAKKSRVLIPYICTYVCTHSELYSRLWKLRSCPPPHTFLDVCGDHRHRQYTACGIPLDPLFQTQSFSHSAYDVRKSKAVAAVEGMASLIPKASDTPMSLTKQGFVFINLPLEFIQV